MRSPIVGGRVQTVDLERASIEPFESLVGVERWNELGSTLADLARTMRGRRLWNINSTARGGGVAELLASLIPYDRGCGIDERWMVIDGPPAFFAFTKRLHNLLHGVDAGGIEISSDERATYESTLGENAAAITTEVRPGDVVLLHDPQVAGLAPALERLGACVLWRCHIGVDEPNDATRAAWRLLTPYLAPARALIFSRKRYEWEGLEQSRVHVLPPAIDPFAVKNRDLSNDDVRSVLEGAGIKLRPNDRVVVQVSRWDRLKDPVGVLEAFARGVAPATDAKLVLAGPAVKDVADDPEQPAVLKAVASCRDSLPARVRDRILIAELPMEDANENATIVNALQRRADVVAQKSLAEGFGLTVAEAMWKARPLVASRVGGIEDQIEDGRSGLLIRDPRDLDAFADAVKALVLDPARGRELGSAARARSVDCFIAPRHLVDQARLIMAVAA